MTEWELSMGLAALWVPVTGSIIGMALKFGGLTHSVQQMKEQMAQDSETLNDIVIRVTKIEVLVDGQIKKS